jgi:hypothetical protein
MLWAEAVVNRGLASRAITKKIIIACFSGHN